MLKIINSLKPFFEDCYRRINVREYAKILNISPPTSSKLLGSYYSKNLLLKHKFKNYILFYANKDNNEFIDLSRIYWKYKFKDLIEYFEKKLTSPTIVLFGSLSKAETKADSDIDLAIFSHKKDLNIENFEKKLGEK